MKKNGFLNINKQNGQALLIVVLVMVVALTVGLSIASKTITSFRNSTDSANSQKALSAAEAGIEQAINKINDANATVGEGLISSLGDASYKTTVSSINGTEFLLNGGNSVSQDSGIDLWLTVYASESANLFKQPYYLDDSGGFTVYWGDSTGDCTNAAIEVVIISGTKAAPVISRYAFDPCQDRRGPTIDDVGNHFEQPTGGQGSVPAGTGKTFYYQATVPVGNGGLIARIVPLYYSSVIGVRSIKAFPSQGSVITSVGSSGTTQRKVTLYQGYPELPAEFYLYNLFIP